MSSPWMFRGDRSIIESRLALVSCLALVLCLALISCLALLLVAAAPVAAQDTPDPSSEPAPLASVGADRESFKDSFDVSGIWGTVDDPSSSIVYEDGALVVTLKQDALARVSKARPAQTSPALRLEVDVEFGADGSSAGPMCGTSSDGSAFAFGAVNTGDSWIVGRMIGDTISLLARGPLEAVDMTIGTPVRVAIECASGVAGDRVAMWVDGQLVAEVTDDAPQGPFDRVGLYADATSGGSVVRFDDAAAFDGGPVPGLLTLGADTEDPTDDFFVPGAWGTADDDSSLIAIEDAALAITLKEDGSGQWTTHPTPQASNEMRLEVDVEIGADGSSAGPMCLTSDVVPDVAFGAVGTSDDWTVGRIVDGAARVIARGHLDETDIAAGTPVRMILECAVTEEGDRMALWIDGQLVADVTGTSQHGPYATVGVYADAVTAGTTTRFRDAVVLTGDAVLTLTGLGADTLVLEDSFDDRSLWSTGKAQQGSVAYGKGTLRIALRLPGSLWSWQGLKQEVPVVRLEGTVKQGDGRGAAGFLCGAPGDETPFYYGGLDSEGDVVVGVAADSVMTELARVPLPEGVEPSASHRLVVECAVTGPTADRVAVWVDGALALDHVTQGSLEAFDKVAVYADSESRRFDAAFDDVILTAGLAYAPVGDALPVTTE